VPIPANPSGLKDERGNLQHYNAVMPLPSEEAFIASLVIIKEGEQMKKIGIGLLGLGTVGSGVVKAITGNQLSISGKLGAELQIKKILVRDLCKNRLVQVPKFLLTKDYQDIVNDPTIDIVVDAMGGIEPAKDFILAAMEKGKHVVTANKEVVAKYGREILDKAEAHGVTFLFEGSVGGGIPIIRPLKQCLVANEITEISGIINGTTNYILTKMATEGKEFAAILKEAQDKGYAEPDPTNDVEGFDAAYKLAILASLAFGTPIKFEDVSFEGISNITREDMAWAAELGCTIKLLAQTKEHADGLEIRVGPSLIPLSHPLAGVNDVFNAFFIKGNLVGELFFSGRGAGDLPTGSAVVADIIEAARITVTGSSVKPVCNCYRQKKVKPKEELQSAYYLRVKVTRSDVMLPVNNLLLQEQVPFAQTVKRVQQGKGGNLVYLTEELEERQIQGIVSKLYAIPGVKEVSLMRLEGSQAGVGQVARV
jgi:homoserine dehydrogenase